MIQVVDIRLRKSAMAQVELIRGTGSELLPHLEKHRDRKDLLLIIPDEKPSGQDSSPATDENGKMVLRNGVPLLPTARAVHPVTLEMVKQLAEEE
jgi:hypothetical protein